MTSRRIARWVSTGRSQPSVIPGQIGRLVIHPKAIGRRRRGRNRSGCTSALKPPGTFPAEQERTTWKTRWHVVEGLARRDHEPRPTRSAATQRRAAAARRQVVADQGHIATDRGAPRSSATNGACPRSTGRRRAASHVDERPAAGSARCTDGRLAGRAPRGATASHP